MPFSRWKFIRGGLMATGVMAAVGLNVNAGAQTALLFPQHAPVGEGQGIYPGSLGVHEHWNNGTDKQYSRRPGKSEGIELIRN